MVSDASEFGLIDPSEAEAPVSISRVITSLLTASGIPDISGVGLVNSSMFEAPVGDVTVSPVL